jgi:hypothetical protein
MMQPLELNSGDNKRRRKGNGRRSGPDRRLSSLRNVSLSRRSLKRITYVFSLFCFFLFSQPNGLAGGHTIYPGCNQSR